MAPVAPLTVSDHKYMCFLVFIHGCITLHSSVYTAISLPDIWYQEILLQLFPVHFCFFIPNDFVLLDKLCLLSIPLLFKFI